MKTKIMTTCLLALLLAASACNKEKLYASYRFICDVDGKKWALGDSSPLDVYIVSDTVLTFTAQAGTSSLSLFVKDMGGIRVGRDYTLDGGAYGKGWYSSGQFATNALYTGTLTITNLDRKNLRISGRFNFQGVSQQSGRSVSITNGFFNSIYYPR